MLFITAIIGLVFFGSGGYWLYSLIRSKFNKEYSPALKPWMSFAICVVAFAVSGTMANKLPELASSSSSLNSQPFTQAEPQISKITMEKFKQIETGMSYQEVVEILGREGEELSSSEVSGYTTIMYQWSEGFANMNAMFQNDSLVSKAQFGLQ